MKFLLYFLTNWLLLGFAGIGVGNDDVDFSSVQSILSDRCYQCHGPDEQARKANLRLDIASAAENVIEAGDIENSELFRRISSTDETEMMPPPESKLELNAKEIATIKLWIENGANWGNHWAFEPLPADVIVPIVKKSTWPNNEIDHFVLSKLESLDLEPNQPANRRRWLRRATFDLTGLPPWLTEIQAFENDQSPEAFEKVVDRLLSSDAYGEHLAVAWLDAVRYADSYGYQSDQLNNQWPYRDWVVDALNKNLPYDEFVTWQLAGDLLPSATREQRMATAFNRIHRLTNEGGSVFEECRIENVADRVNTYGTAILGLTIECARCHDHKFDPISSRDYYSLFAFFNSIAENGLYDKTAKVPSPSMLLPTDEQQQALDEAARNLRMASQHYAQVVQESKSRWRSWQPTVQSNELKVADPELALDFDQPVNPERKKKYFASTDDKHSVGDLPVEEVVDCDIPGMNSGEIKRMAIVFDGDRGITTGGVLSFDRWTPFSVVLTLRETKRSPLRSVIAHHTRGTDAGFNGWDLTMEDGFVESRLYRVWPGNGVGVRTTQRIPVDQWQQLTATYDGSSQAAGLDIYLNGSPLETQILRDDMIKSANVAVGHGGEFVLGQRFRSRGLAGGQLDDARVFLRQLTNAEIKSLADGSAVEPSHEYFISVVDEPAKNALQELNRARQAMVMAEEAVAEIPIMRELETPLPAHVLARGQYDAPRTEANRVTRNTPASIGPEFDESFPQNRLGLANWTTLKNHPLTSRVFVNRLWTNFFGRGLVSTPEDFGVQGNPPTHPRLLDWLARDFVDSGWNIKRLCRNIVLSSTYRQNSVPTANALESDPQNKLLARGPAHRLSAEQIRDLALAASGLINRKIGGPPVSPYQAGGDLWRESNSMSPAYRQSVGKSLYRRSLYSVWKRTAPLPNMSAFDVGSREVCSVKRSRTNTPLQALVLLNDVQFIESARVLATRVMTTSNSQDEQINAAFLLFAGRDADEKELGLLLDLLEDELSYYEDNNEDAKELCAVGESVLPDDIDQQHLAAMTTVCQAILSLDASIWKR